MTAPDPSEQLQLAARFPDLEVGDCIGRGGMGVVYRVRQKHLDRVAALKVLAREVARDEQALARFEREARALARLDHDGVVRIYDFGIADGKPWLLMEFVAGASLRATVATGPLAPERALAIVAEACAALACAHAAGVVHRDVKPENLLLDGRGRVRVVDFGLAKLTGVESRNVRLTVTEQGFGTFRYVAPEQAEQAASADARADVYSLGVVCYEMLTGTMPVGRFEPPSRLRPGIDPRVDDIVLCALQADPGKRYRDAGAMLAALAALDSAGSTGAAAGGSAADAARGLFVVQRALIAVGAAMFVVSLLRWSIAHYRTAQPYGWVTLWQRYYWPGGWFLLGGWLPALAGLGAVMVALQRPRQPFARAAMWTLAAGAAAVVIELWVPHWLLASSDTVVPPLGWFALCCAVPAVAGLEQRAAAQPALAARLGAHPWRTMLPLAPLLLALVVAVVASFES